MREEVVVPLRERVLPRLAPLVSRVVTLGHHLLNSMSLGVRVVALLPDGRVVLVRHGYVPGWHLPGGGVDRGETLRRAAVRELAEETGLAPLAPPRLVGVYVNARVSRRNHVALFVADVAGPPVRRPDWEIAAVDAFVRTALPEDTTTATRRRLDEVFGVDGRTVEADEEW